MAMACRTGMRSSISAISPAPPAIDGDGDGIQLSAEYSGGTPSTLWQYQPGGWRLLCGFGLGHLQSRRIPTYMLRSVPAGTVNQTAIAPPGTVVTTPDLSANASFGYWTLDGVRQQDAWGVALPQISFTMGSVNREAVAYLFAGDTMATACRMPTSSITTARSPMARLPTRMAMVFPCWRNTPAGRIRFMPTPIRTAAWPGRTPRW